MTSDLFSMHIRALMDHLLDDSWSRYFSSPEYLFVRKKMNANRVLP